MQDGVTGVFRQYGKELQVIQSTLQELQAGKV